MKVFKLKYSVQNNQGPSSTKQKDEELRANTISPLHPDPSVFSMGKIRLKSATNRY